MRTRARVLLIGLLLVQSQKPLRAACWNWDASASPGITSPWINLRIGRTALEGLLSLGLETAPATAQDMAERFPENTLLYFQWPGSDGLMAAAKDTSFARLVAEPEMQHCRAKVATALTSFIAAKVEADGLDPEVAKGFTAIIGMLWHKPMAIGLIGVVPQGMSVDAAIVIRAGQDAPAMIEHIEKLMAAGELPMQHVIEREFGSITWKELSVLGPTLPLRWAVVGEDVVFSVGPRTAQHLGADQQSTSLAASERFTQAMKLTDGSAAVSLLYADIKRAVATLEDFQPLLATKEIPILGEEGGVQRVLAALGLESMESYTATLVPECEHFRNNFVVYAPGLQSSPTTARWVGTSLTDNDFKVVPKNVTMAGVKNVKLRGFYEVVVDAVKAASPEAHEAMMGAIGGFEDRIDASVANDLLGAFGENWAVYDAPSHGGFWITGLTLVAKAQPENKLDKALRGIISLIAEATDMQDRLTVRQENYRDQKISYVNMVGVPLPIAPAWGQYEDRWILALYPQMVRAAMTHLIDKQPSILDNADFQRGRKTLPAQMHSIAYTDTTTGVRQIYSIGLPIAELLLNMGQGEGFDLDGSAIPSLATISRHTFGQVSGMTVTDAGLVYVTTSSLPVSAPAIGPMGAFTTVPLMTSVMLPSLTRARTLAKRTVSAQNLKGIGTAIAVYANENLDKFPPSFGILTQTNMVLPKMLISPLEVNEEALCSYIYISGQSADGDPRNVVVYEKPVNYDGEGTNVLFADGHVEFLDMDQFEEVLSQTANRLGRPLEIRGLSADEEIDAEGLPASAGQEGDETAPEDKATENREPALDDSVRQESLQGAAPADGNRRTIARNMVGTGGPLATQLDLFHQHMERYPRELIELVEKPDNEDEAALWKGPYVRSFENLIDPWGHGLQYRSPGEHSPKYDLWSVGPDGESDTRDDIGSWMK